MNEKYSIIRFYQFKNISKELNVNIFQLMEYKMVEIFNHNPLIPGIN